MMKIKFCKFFIFNEKARDRIEVKLDIIIHNVILHICVNFELKILTN